MPSRDDSEFTGGAGKEHRKKENTNLEKYLRERTQPITGTQK